MNIQWYPGHMAKTRRLLSENLKMVDVVIELLDARIPRSSKNPEIDDIIKEKPRVIAFNKSDLADDKISKDWSKWYNSLGHASIFIDSIKGTGINELKSKLNDAVKDKIERQKQKGYIFRPIRTMVVGVPNVGKSSFINKIAGKASAVTGDKPGVTRGKQWIRINEKIELLDTPGILWPKFDDMEVGFNLAFTGAIKDEIYDIVEVAAALFERLSKIYPDKLAQRYKLDSVSEFTGLELLNMAGKKRGCLISGGEIDLYRIAAIALDEFRGGKIGRISLEKCSEPVSVKEGDKDAQQAED
ncbi:MAG: ribosome biogenesis GTPase YlqF [Bacillota bacterium]|nr:ribosome biogenesis GTPase YlqF [Bacillota bacterium]